MTPEQAWVIAAQWGSYISAGDPGACMYGFNAKGVVQSELHRQQCLDWIDNHCRNAADINIAAGDSDNDHAELDALRAYLVAAPVGACL